MTMTATATKSKSTKQASAPAGSAFMLTAQVESLAKSFSLAASVCPSRCPKPVLEFVLLTADADGNCTLAATDMMVSVTIKISGVRVDGSGKPFVALLPAKRFQSILSSLRSDELQLRYIDESNLQLVAGRTRMQFPTMKPDEFPAPVARHPKHMLTVSAVGLSTAILRTTYACDVESSRYSLGGICIEATAGKPLTIIATDGRRVAIQKLDCQGEAEAIHENTLLSFDACQAVRKLIANKEGEVEIGSSNNTFFLDSETLTFSAQLTEGRFPRWRDIVPKNVDKFTVHAGLLLTAIQQVSVVNTDEKFSADWSLRGDVLSLESEAPETGTSHAEIVVGDATCDTDLTLNSDYMKQYLSKCDPESLVEISFSNSAGAMVCKSPEGVYVVMPIGKD
jgi:DNA polymerase-3 subunit beta